MFKDHFSSHAASYAKFRPSSPKELFVFLNSTAKSHDQAWDVGTGNGQAALDLVPYFEKITATDASQEQIKNAVTHPKIRYEISKAEESLLPSHSVDLITVAQALHWFNFEKFYAEVKRVLKPGGILAVWTYGLAFISPEIDTAMREFYDGPIGKFWPPERKMVDEGYQSIPFPFEEIKAPAFSMNEERNFDDWCGYIASWSAVQRAIKAEGPRIFESFVVELQKQWGDPKNRKSITWPLGLRVGRV